MDCIYTAKILEQLREQAKDLVVSEGEMAGLRPAVCCVYEWESYMLNLDGVEALLVGSTEIQPRITGIFELNFKNQLGLTRLQPMRGGKPVAPEIYLEVLSRKFPTVGEHMAFHSNLLSDLFQRFTRLPYTLKSPTGRSVVESMRPPNPLFTYYFLKHYAKDILSNLNVILNAPHRLLIDEESYVPLAEASNVGPDSILDMIQHSSAWSKAENHPLAYRLKGFVPTSIIQRLSEETFDTPENRFILTFLNTLQSSAANLFTQSWWQKTPENDRKMIRETHSLIQQAVMSPVFEDIDELKILPMNSQVLLRKDGYRQMLELWQKFQQARRPIFEPLRYAMEIKDVATLYEYWVFFSLVDEIGNILNIKPVLELLVADDHGLNWSSRAYFGSQHFLAYNLKFTQNKKDFHSYSTTLRPDYTWVANGKPVTLFDAKFSFRELSVNSMEDELDANTLPALGDLYKMHTYRDALGVNTVVIIFPGTQKVFYDTGRGQLSDITLADCLQGTLSGIGALPMSPANQQ